VDVGPSAIPHNLYVVTLDQEDMMAMLTMAFPLRAALASSGAQQPMSLRAPFHSTDSDRSTLQKASQMLD
jgi:hypothetical protein